MHHPIGILTDNPDWVRPLLRAMRTAGVPDHLIPFPPPPDTGLAGDPDPQVIFNRVAIRTAMGAPGITSLVRDMLTALQLQGRRIINNAHCHHVGASKGLQALLFRRAGVMHPRTMVLSDREMLPWAREQIPEGMLKANVGGFGAGVWAPGSPDEAVPPAILEAAFAADGLAVWQERYTPRDDVIYRVELIGGEVLYQARVPVERDRFNYCLGNAGGFSGPGGPGDPVVLDQAPDTLLRMSLERICALAEMEVGSVEYLIPEGASTPLFFDINPVSTYHPSAAAFLGFDPYQRLAAWLSAVSEEI